MEWLARNWILVAFAIGAFLLMRRGGMGCGHSGGGHHGGGRHGDHGAGQRDGDSPAGMPMRSIDPVSGKPVDPGKAVASVYRGEPVYFESREHRDRFELSPELYFGPKSLPRPEHGRHVHG